MLGCISLYLPICLSCVGGSGLPSDLTPLTDLGFVDFAICSAFYCWMKPLPNLGRLHLPCLGIWSLSYRYEGLLMTKEATLRD